MGLTLKKLPSDTITFLPKAPNTVKPERMEPSFDYESLAELVEKFEQQSPDNTRAQLDLVGGKITLVIFNKSESKIEGYYFADNEQFYQALDFAYEAIQTSSSMGDDFADRWEAFMQVIEPTKIIDADFD